MSVRRLFIGIAPLLLVLAPTVAEAQQKFVAALRGAQEVPSNSSTATGACMVTLNAAATQVSVSCSYAGLSSSLTAGHIHGLAGVGVNAGIMIDFGSVPAGTSGTFTAGPSAITGPQVDALRSNNLYINLHTTTVPAGEIRGQLKRTTTVFDRDGDGRTDVTIFRSSTAAFWTQRSLDGGLTHQTFGPTSGNIRFNTYQGEWDGDGIADSMLLHIDVTASTIWSIYQSRTQTARYVAWGHLFSFSGAPDIEAPADYDGDGILDIAVFKRSTGDWWILQSSTGTLRFEHFGTTGDFPSIGDYDGDGKADLTVLRPTAGQPWVWWTLRSSDGLVTVGPFGTASDTFFFFAPVDIDGDNQHDKMVIRIDSGQRQFITQRSSDAAITFVTWGLSTDTDLVGDYDGDGKTDFVARRNVGGNLVWFVRKSSDGQTLIFYWGLSPGDQ